jgi:hypothetical protein
MIALVTFVEPQPREMSQTIPQARHRCRRRAISLGSRVMPRLPGMYCRLFATDQWLRPIALLPAGEILVKFRPPC